jgi:hypothetical protein
MVVRNLEDKDVSGILSAKTLILTRMRNDNLPILKIADRLGFQRTGIKIPSRQPGTFHEYWYLTKVGS